MILRSYFYLISFIDETMFNFIIFLFFFSNSLNFFFYFFPLYLIN